MDLRGFDSYEISLGDEMRGERASLGKTLADAESDLRIKARLIVAIENCDLAGFPNSSVVAGYVRSYARYLGMDAEDCYRRFCRESGFQSHTTLQTPNSGLAGRAVSGAAQGAISAVGAGLAESRFAAPPRHNRFRARVSLGAVSSAAALVALICGLGYGGYAVLQDIQRVTFAPLPEAPSVVADAPLIEVPTVDAQTLRRPSADDYRGGGVLAAMAAPTELPEVELVRRDGPISAIDPNTAGIFARRDEERFPAIDSADDAIAEATRRANATPEVDATPRVETGPRGVVLHASEDAWVRVRDNTDTVLFEGILGAGQRFALPVRVQDPVLKSGNAGGIFVFLDGVAYGPVGQRGQVARNISLSATDIRAGIPQAAADLIALPSDNGPEQRAEALVDR